MRHGRWRLSDAQDQGWVGRRAPESRALRKQSVVTVRKWPFASVVKVRFGAARVGRLLSADEINNRIGAERPIRVTHRSQSERHKAAAQDGGGRPCDCDGVTSPCSDSLRCLWCERARFGTDRSIKDEEKDRPSEEPQLDRRLHKKAHIQRLLEEAAR